MRKTMNKLLFLAMTLLLSACASTDASAQAPPDPCKNLNKPNKPLQLQLDEFELVLKRKKRMCLDFRNSNSGTFRIRVDAGDSGYTVASGTITVEGKDQSTGAPAISGSNSADPELIVVDVRDASVQSPNSEDYAYWIKVPGVGTLDPKVRIIRQNSVPLKAQDLGMALEDIGMDREEAQRLLEQCQDLARCTGQPTEQY